MMKFLFLWLCLALLSSWISISAEATNKALAVTGRSASSTKIKPTKSGSPKRPLTKIPGKGITGKGGKITSKKDMASKLASAKKILEQATKIVSRAQMATRESVKMMNKTLSGAKKVTNANVNEFVNRTMSLSMIATKVAMAEYNVANELLKEAKRMLDKVETGKIKDTSRKERLLNYVEKRSRDAMEASKRCLKSCQLSAQLDFDALYESMNFGDKKNKTMFRSQDDHIFAGIMDWLGAIKEQILNIIDQILGI